MYWYNDYRRKFFFLCL